MKHGGHVKMMMALWVHTPLDAMDTNRSGSHMHLPREDKEKPTEVVIGGVVGQKYVMESNINGKYGAKTI